MTTPLIEAIARAIYAQSYRNCCHGESPEVGDESWQSYLSEAAAAITALTEAGYVTLPAEPTIFQLVKLGAPGGTLEERGVDPGDQSLYDIYAAVIAATPVDSEKGE